jgi:L-alanine-DL-glutamate epimerase-like enolase superfamily enzyme
MLHRASETFPTDIRILELEPFFKRERARTPLKFGGVVMADALLLRCRAKVENRRGNVAEGWGAIFLADFWAWPSSVVEHELREEAMRQVSIEYAKAISSMSGYYHPIDIFIESEGELKSIARRVCQEMQLKEEMPFLAALVCASAIDASLHDAFGNVNGIDSYLGYGKECMRDLGYYLGEGFAGKYISDYIRPSYSHEVPVFHLVGGLDKLTRSEVDESDPKDGLPNCLEEWIELDGVFCLKVKLRGNDLQWDLQRLLDVYAVGIECNRRLGRERIFMTADTNEMCETPEYMVELLLKLKERSEEAFESLLYIEQPTHRDLRSYPFDMRRLASIKPVLMDESLTDFEMYELGKQLGISGIALKTCKGHSMCMLMVAKATEEGIPYAVQDLTNPSIALLHSVGMAARINPIMGVEANSRQFFPEASKAEMEVHRDIVVRQNGVLKTHSLKGTGFGYQIERIKPLWQLESIP